VVFGPSGNTTSVPLSTGNQATISVNTGGTAFCVLVTRATGSQAGSQTAWAYISNLGGLQPAGTTSCTGLA
jgi:hypothetical protein